jgi:Tol biopolymer transport system component
MQVELWLMNSDGSGKHRILSFFGGQGSINVNSWSKDSKEFAFVSYELV